jgi:hypothetical protein
LQTLVAVAGGGELHFVFAAANSIGVPLKILTVKTGVLDRHAQCSPSIRCQSGPLLPERSGLTAELPTKEKSPRRPSRETGGRGRSIQDLKIAVAPFLVAYLSFGS